MFPLSVRDATVTRRGKRLIGPVDLDLMGRGATILIGPNGSGKTTLLNMLHGTTRTKQGSIEWACGLAKARAAQSFVFQKPVLLRRSVLGNLCYPLTVRGASRRNAEQIAIEWAEKVGLIDSLETPAHGLSGGEQQKLALARALVTQPDLIFLDEPCASLDGRSTREIETILKAAKQNGTRLILSTHDMGQARRLADDILFVLHGRIHEHRVASEFFEAPKTSEARAFLEGDILE